MGSIERRSGVDSRPENEKQLAGERRSGMERRSRIVSTGEMPSSEQLALFGRRLRRAMRDEKGRSFFGVASGEDHFTVYPEVVRVLDWIEQTTAPEPEATTKPVRTMLSKAAV